MLPDRVTILASDALKPEEIDVHRAQQQLDRGQKMWNEAGESEEAYDEALRVISEAEAKMASAAESRQTALIRDSLHHAFKHKALLVRAGLSLCHQRASIASCRVLRCRELKRLILDRFSTSGSLIVALSERPVNRSNASPLIAPSNEAPSPFTVMISVAPTRHRGCQNPHRL